jgi:hypothetical protein
MKISFKKLQLQQKSEAVCSDLYNKDASCKCKPDPIFCFQTNHNNSTPVTAIFSFLHIYCVLFTFSVIVIGLKLLFRFSDKPTAQDIVAMSLKRFSWFITLTQ